MIYPELRFDLSDALRFLGVKNGGDDVTVSLINSVFEEIKSVAEVKIFSAKDRTIHLNQGINCFSRCFLSKNFADRMVSATTIILLGATLGQSVDRLIKRYSLTNSARSAVMQAVSGSVVDCLIDDVEKEIKKDNEVVFRYSVGYGDFDLSYQKDCLEILEAQKTLGITLSDGYIMSPSKSVTAFIGVKEKI